MKRRSFLAAILAAGVAPASARSGVLMPIRPSIIVPPLVLVPWKVWWMVDSQGRLCGPFRLDGN